MEKSYSLAVGSTAHINKTELQLLACGVAQVDIDIAKKESLKNDIRKQREPLLIEADIAISKVVDNNENAADLRVYRQALRDITTTFADDLANVVWPVKPL